MVDHTGSLQGGHYTATVLSSEDSTWYMFNDEHVNKVSRILLTDLIMIVHIQMDVTNQNLWVPIPLYPNQQTAQILKVHLLNFFFPLWCRLMNSHLQRLGLTSMCNEMYFIKCLVMIIWYALINIIYCVLSPFWCLVQNNNSRIIFHQLCDCLSSHVQR